MHALDTGREGANQVPIGVEIRNFLKFFYQQFIDRPPLLADPVKSLLVREDNRQRPARKSLGSSKIFLKNYTLSVFICLAVGRTWYHKKVSP